jgi:uncharacterized protein YecE (DUF72 family)
MKLPVAPGAAVWHTGPMRLHVGTATLRGNVRAYASRFDLLELRAEKGKLPRRSRLEAMAKEVPEGFVFSVVLPRLVASLEAGERSDEELAFALDAAKALSASWLVIQTEPRVMPSTRTKKALAALVAKLPRDVRLAWEPRGLWEAAEAEAVAEALDIVLVRDVSREPAPDGEVVYTRLRALGRSSLSLGAIERVAEEIADRELACVVLEGDRAVGAAKSLKQIVAELAGEEHAGDDEELEEDDELEDDEDFEDDEES